MDGTYKTYGWDEKYYIHNLGQETCKDETILEKDKWM
jgi:hypothetical protein